MRKTYFTLALTLGLLISFTLIKRLPRLVNAAVLAVSAQAPTTLLSLSFDNTLNGAQGEVPSQATGVTFEAGGKGQGALIDGTDVLQYAATDNFNAAEGTIEFMVKPQWNGNDNTGHFFFSIGDDMILLKDGGNYLRFIFKGDDSEAYQGYYIGNWAANQWHHIAITWKVPGTMKTYVDGVERISHTASAQDLLSLPLAALSIGSRNNTQQADAVFDELTISDVQRSATEIANRYLENLTLTNWTLNPATHSIEMYPGWSYWVPLTIQADTNFGSLTIPLTAITWTSSNPAVAVMLPTGKIKGLAPGTTNLIGSRDGRSVTIPVTILQPARAVVEETIDPFLAMPATDYLWKMPVVIIRYFPTRDGVNVDAPVADYTGTLAQLKSKQEQLEIKHKFMLEEGSRFRGYQNAQARPALGYQVVKIFTVYEEIPPGFPTEGGAYFPDYQQILERFNGEQFVNNLGVKEFWIEHYHHGRIVPVESNMSSPLTGDISNSYRSNDDLPIYNKTYVVYGINFTRGENEATHNHGHQLESILTYANQRQDGNSLLFWKQFSGQDDLGNFKQGRCGNTHFPPNGTGDYDYDNPTAVQSDCEDWTPANSGQKKSVNNATWRDLPYVWPNGLVPSGKTEAQYYLYWMQNMPGRGNQIPYNTNRMTNWWAFTGDWDGAIKAGMGLYEPSACDYQLSKTDENVSAGVTDSTVNITCSSGCKWFASSNATWITLTNVTTGNGNGQVAYQVKANDTNVQRIGTILIGGKTLTITQAAGTGCTVSISNLTQLIARAGGTLNLPVTSSCEWTVTNNNAWFSVSPTNGTGDATLTVTVQANTGADRVGTFTIADKTVTIDQRTTLIVTNANDSGVGSLRQAIIDTNAIPGLDTITFDPGVSSIAPLSALPDITDPVVIDGGIRKVELNGTNAGGANGLVLTGANSAGSTIKNLVINRFFSGIVIQSTSSNNKVQGCLIGTDPADMAALPNTSNGVVLNAPNNLIGGATIGERNIISGNNSHGIMVQGTTATGNVIKGNFIGTDVTGTLDLGNRFDGILVSNAPGTIIGGTTAGERNVISGNNSYGVDIGGSNGNKIIGNYIGTDATGTADVGNSFSGINLAGVSDNFIGGATSGEGNLISGNDQNGILIRSSAFLSGGVATPILATNNKIQGNLIGTDVTGKLDLGNSLSGLSISGSSNNLIGGSTANERNVISGNDSVGVAISASVITVNGISTPVLAAAGNRVLGNFIGTDVTGMLDVGNNLFGVGIAGGAGNIIGTANANERNIISGNDRDGVFISSTTLSINGTPTAVSATSNKVQGNFIGTKADGLSALGNAFAGVVVLDTVSNTMGGANAGEGNVIAFNDVGVVINDAAGAPSGRNADFNSIQGNSIFSNTQLGIQLSQVRPSAAPFKYYDGTPKANDADDADDGPNNFQNYPVLTSACYYDTNPAATGGEMLRISGTLDTITGKTYRLEFFANDSCDASGNGEGETLLGAQSLNVASTNQAFSCTLDLTAVQAAAVSGAGKVITATATDPDGNTSEFSLCRTVIAPTLAINNVSVAEGASGTTNAIFTVTLSGANGLSDSISVDFATANNTATAGTDYVAKSSSLLFSGPLNSNSITQTIAVVVNGDVLDEATETFFVNLSNPLCATIQTPQGTGTIINDFAPTITAAPAVTRQAGSPAASATIATVNDFETSAANLTVAVLGTLPTGISLNTITNSNGTISGQVAAGCNATPGANVVTLQVTDGSNRTATAMLTINVTANTAPTLGMYANSSVLLGNGTTITLSAAPTDNVSISSVSASASAGFTGTVGVNAATGTVTIGNAGPAGTYTITVTAMDNCGLTATKSFQLRVDRLNSATTLASSANKIAIGQSVILTANVTPPSATGQVEFFNNLTSLGKATVVSGKAMLILPSLALGNYSLRAVYQGDATYDTSEFASLPLLVVNTKEGANVSLTFAGVRITFANITKIGNTTITPINPTSAGQLPGGFSFGDPGVAFEITTDAVYSGPITLTFTAPSTITSPQFTSLRVFHGENGQLVDRTILAPDTPASNFGAKEISARVNSLSPFVLAFGAGGTAPAVSSSKAGSVLVFPYYTAKAAAKTDTRLTISNISDAPTDPQNPNYTYVHLFFIDGTSCQQSDLFLCLTPNASFSFKASEFDPETTGWLLAVAVNGNGNPIRNNVLVGNAFVSDGDYVDNYGAESFWANSAAPATINNNMATLNFNGVDYDQVAAQLTAELQSPADAANQRIVTVGLSGDLLQSKLEGAAQIGVGTVYNGNETPFGSFSNFLTGNCQARAIISAAAPRVPNGLATIIPTSQTGSLKFNVGAAVGLLMTPRTAKWKGIRGLHKTALTTSTVVIPVITPVC